MFCIFNGNITEDTNIAENERYLLIIKLKTTHLPLMKSKTKHILKILKS